MPIFSRISIVVLARLGIFSQNGSHIGRYPLVSVDPSSILRRAISPPPHFPPLTSVDLARVWSLAQLIFFLLLLSLSLFFPFLSPPPPFFFIFHPFSLILFSSFLFPLPSFLPFFFLLYFPIRCLPPHSLLSPFLPFFPLFFFAISILFPPFLLFI